MVLLTTAACQGGGLAGSGARSAPTPSAARVEPPAGWQPLYGAGVSLFLPPGWAGGDPATEATGLANTLRTYGPEYEQDAVAVEAAARGARLWALDGRALAPGRLVTAHVAGFYLPGVDLAAHLDRVLSNNPPGESIEAGLLGTVNGAETARLEISQTAASPARRALLYIFHEGDTFYHLTFSVPAENYAAAVADFEESVRTFRTGTQPGPNPTLPPAAQSGPPIAGGDPAASEGLRLTDDFSDAASGWEQLNTPYGQYAYLDGEYKFLIYQAGALLWSVREEQASDLTLEVTARFGVPSSSSESGLVGLVCGYAGMEDFFYAALTNTGYYGLFQVTPQGEAFVGMTDWQLARNVRFGSEPNRLRLDCVQGVMQFWINGELITAVAAPQALNGQFGVLAGSFNWTAAQMVFDDFELRPFVP